MGIKRESSSEIKALPGKKRRKENRKGTGGVGGKAYRNMSIARLVHCVVSPRPPPGQRGRRKKTVLKGPSEGPRSEPQGGRQKRKWGGVTKTEEEKKKSG